jgi:flavin reductase (DIM6/NTAB) family NADH-FMN oxidoreductase RutF
VSSQHKGKRDIMSMGWHMVMEFEPSMIGCFITSANRSFDLIKKSEECVINIPEAHLLDTIIAIGNQPGGDKFEQFGLTAGKARKVKAPVISECYAHFECKLIDKKLIKPYSMFVFKVVKAQAATSPKYPKTVHYRGDGVFMMSGENVSRKAQFRPENL